MDRLRIAYLANFFPNKLGTGETRLLALAEAARSRDHELTIYGHEPVHPQVRKMLHVRVRRGAG